MIFCAALSQVMRLNGFLHSNVSSDKIIFCTALSKVMRLNDFVHSTVSSDDTSLTYSMEQSPS
jgi:hypothetical protein